MRVLAPFSKRATKEDRVAFIFRIYDVDGDGVVSHDDLELMVRMLAGKSLRSVQHPSNHQPPPPLAHRDERNADMVNQRALQRGCYAAGLVLPPPTSCAA